jgi:spermidine/putrescine-binding protein
MVARHFTALLFVALLVVACKPAGEVITAKALNVYSFSAYLPADLVAGFEKATGVKVSLTTYSTNEEMLAGLAANPGQYDVIIPSDYTVEILIKQKALQPLDLGAIPNYNNIDPAFLSPYFDPGGATTGRRLYANDHAKYTLPYQWGTTGIVYNQTKVNPPITQWNDLWRPELQGHLVVLDDARELMGLTLLSLGYDKNSTDPTQLAAARDKLKQLTPGIVAYDSATPENSLLSGAAWAGVVFSGNAALAARQNPNMVYVFPQEGAGIWFDNLAIPADAPHADAARAFINYVLAPENSVLITRDFPYSNPNRAALQYLEKNNNALYQQYHASVASNPPPDAVAKAKLNKNVGAELAALYQQYWNEAKAK